MSERDKVKSKVDVRSSVDLGWLMVRVSWNLVVWEIYMFRVRDDGSRMNGRSRLGIVWKVIRSLTLRMCDGEG